MKKALSAGYSPKERASTFNNLYYNYKKEHGSDKNWNEFNLSLRKKCANKLTEKQKQEFGLNKNEVRLSYFELKKSIPKQNKSFFPVEVFYENSYPLIRGILSKGAILEIGFGDYPTLVNLLNKKGYSAFGIEPSPKIFDKTKTFKASMKNFPKELEQKYDLILANMVYSINYTHFFAKNFRWELRNKGVLIKKIASLLKPKGHLILVDDLGTIFSKKELKKYFKIILFEKDVPAIDFNKNKIVGFGRITLIRKI